MTIETYNHPPVRRVVHVTTVHPRNDMRILHKECGVLTNAGYDVHLVVGDGQGDAVVEGQAMEISPLRFRRSVRHCRLRYSPS